MELSTCGLALGENWRELMNIAYYSHLIPAALTIFLGMYALIKTRYSKITIIFAGFTFAVAIWLINDVILWTVQDYYYITFFWSWIDLVNVVFFALGAYFFGILARENISTSEKIIMFVVCVPAFFITLTGNSITDFFEPWCEATENSTMTSYKLFAEGIYTFFILFSLVKAWNTSDRNKKIQISLVAVAILLFFATFSVTEYIATVTDIYEINLYGLFVLPVFLVAMVYAITNLQVFQIRYLGTQLLTYVLILMVASQFLFLESSTDAALNVITLTVTVFLGFVLLRNARRELATRLEIEKLAKQLAVANERLRELDKAKSEFVSIASHQLRAPLTAIRGYASMLLEGTYGTLPDKMHEPTSRIEESSRYMALSIDDFLNVSRIESGQMKYEKSVFSLKEQAEALSQTLALAAEKRGLTLEFRTEANSDMKVTADVGKVRQIISNMIDNAMKYTPKGSITVTAKENTLRKVAQIAITDTGIGLSEATIAKLFEKFSRATNANKVNVTGTGLGLFIARQMAVAMGGNITVASEGEGKGSTFTLELPLVS